MIDLKRNGRIIAKDVSTYEAFIKLALIDNFVFSDELDEDDIHDLHEIYLHLGYTDLDIGDLDYLIYNVDMGLGIATLKDFLKVLRNNENILLDFVDNRVNNFRIY